MLAYHCASIHLSTSARRKAIELMADRKITPDVKVLPRANSTSTVRKPIMLYQLMGKQVRRLDADGDGSISMKEVLSHMTHTAKEAMDIDGDGQVSWKEVILSFFAMLKDLPNHRSWQRKVFHNSELAVLRLYGKTMLFILFLVGLWIFYLWFGEAELVLKNPDPSEWTKKQREVCMSLFMTEEEEAGAEA